jgi:ATP-dependent Lon protease
MLVINNASSNSEETEVKHYKRKLREIEQDLENHKKRKTGDEDIKELRDKLMLLDIDLETKSYIVDKYDITEKMTGSDHSKNMAWLKTVANIPYGKYKQLGVNAEDSSEKLEEFFKNVKNKLDKSILGLENVKQEILEFVARKITNPLGKGHVLALCGVKGVGKTKIIKSLADALDLPFYQINFGGLNDVSILTGHSETYVGSKPGKLVEILSNAQYMNPIVYLDELDKMSSTKSREINGILTHMLDEEQNNKFQDNYLSNVNINLSKVFFVIAFNDITKVDEIVSDRMTIIYVNSPSLEEKVKICQEKMIPEIVESVHFKDNYIIRMDKEMVEYVIFNKISKEEGVRQLKKTIEKIMYKLNYDILINNLEKLKIEKFEDKNIVIITKKYIDNILTCQEDQSSYAHMYI